MCNVRTGVRLWQGRWMQQSEIMDALSAVLAPKPKRSWYFLEPISSAPVRGGRVPCTSEVHALHVPRVVAWACTHSHISATSSQTGPQTSRAVGNLVGAL